MLSPSCAPPVGRAFSLFYPPRLVNSVFGHHSLRARRYRRFVACARRAGTAQTVLAEDEPESLRSSSNAQHEKLVHGPAGDIPPVAPDPAPEEGVSKLLPKLMLLCTAILWGSYAPSLRLVYTSPSPPDPVVVMAIRGVLQAAALVLASSLQQQPQQQAQQGQQAQQQAQQQQAQQGQQQQAQQGQQQQAQQQAGSHAGQPSSGTAAAAVVAAERSMAGVREEGEGVGLLEQWITLKSPPLWMAAAELGLWNYMATAMQTFGLQLTSATRASFLIQATALLTPLLATLAGERLGGRVWAGCALALGGTLLIATDTATGGAASGVAPAAGFHLGGDAAILLAALFYSLATVRVTRYARALSPVKIATGKSLVLAGVALATFATVAAAGAAQGRSPAALWEGYGDLRTWAVLAWSAVGPGALAAYFHVRGQKDVPPAEAQVVFSSVPLWSAGFAWVLLGGEQLGALTWVGGGALVAAGIVASMAPQQQLQQAQKEV